MPAQRHAAQLSLRGSNGKQRRVTAGSKVPSAVQRRMMAWSDCGSEVWLKKCRSWRITSGRQRGCGGIGCVSPVTAHGSATSADVLRMEKASGRLTVAHEVNHDALDLRPIQLVALVHALVDVADVCAVEEHVEGPVLVHPPLEVVERRLQAAKPSTDEPELPE